MTAINEQPRWPFYLLWVVLTAVCVLIAFFFDLVLMRVVTFFVGDYVYVDGVRHIAEDYLYMYTFVPIVGFLTGALQYGLLRRYLPQMGSWVAMTLGGWLVGGFLTLMPGWLGWISPVFSGGLALVVLGLSIGVGQWLLLRRRLPRAGWWIGANGAGWGSLALILGDTSIGPIGLFLVGFVPACVTAVMLALLLKQAPSAKPQAM